MFGNIKKNNARGCNLKLNNDKFYDFKLFKGETYNGGISDISPIASFNYKTFINKQWVSDIEWNESINEGLVLKNIGLTGIDNGQITYHKDRIGDSEFLKIFTDSELVLDDKKFKLTQVWGNTKQFTYPIEVAEDGIALKGGFFQGFYKIEGVKYEVLPNKIEGDWNVEVVLRKRDYEVDNTILNNRFPENKGIFFYIGTRAENKFARYYNGGEEVWCDNITENAFPEGYVNTESSLRDIEVFTEDGFSINKQGEYDIPTDNKHIFFNRTKNGFTVDTWDEDIEVIIREEKRKNDNVFEIANRSKTGKTAQEIGEMLTVIKGYNIYNDLKENAFALKINDNGSISYRYLVGDCEKENRINILSETTKGELIKDNEWSTINTRFLKINDDKMKLCIYVNGNLVLVSKELPMFNFRGLNDVSSKQETVPYNISIGGGTQGLIDAVWKDWYRLHEDIESPLANNFAGTFIGDIKTFRFYNTFLTYKVIKDNVFKN